MVPGSSVGSGFKLEGSAEFCRHHDHCGKSAKLNGGRQSKWALNGVGFRGVIPGERTICEKIKGEGGF